jgi:pilus assembly protein Flp/PilA
MKMGIFAKLLKDQSGASAAEYALILAIIGAGIAVAAFALGGSISNAMSDAGSCLDAQPTSTAC